MNFYNVNLPSTMKPNYMKRLVLSIFWVAR